MPTEQSAVQFVRELVNRNLLLSAAANELYLRVSTKWPHDPDLSLVGGILDRFEGAVFDVGANSGQTLRYLKRVAPRREFIAFEPNPSRIKSLRRMAGDAATTRIVHAAVSDRAGDKIELYVPSIWGIPLHTAVSVDRQAAHAALRKADPMFAKYVRMTPFTAETVTLDDFDVKPALIKIDVEGHEVAALRGSARHLTEHRPFILCETTSHAQEIGDLLTMHDYVSYVRNERGGLRAASVAESSVSRNTFFIPQELTENIPGQSHQS